MSNMTKSIYYNGGEAIEHVSELVYNQTEQVSSHTVSAYTRADRLELRTKIHFYQELELDFRSIIIPIWLVQ